MAVRYVCTEKCFHKKLYRVGDYAYFNSAKDGPTDKKGKLIHFELVDVVNEVKKTGPIVKVNNQEV